MHRIHLQLLALRIEGRPLDAAKLKIATQYGGIQFASLRDGFHELDFGVFLEITGEPFPISDIYPCSPRPTRDLRVGFESCNCDFVAGEPIMLRLSTNRSLLAANIAGLPFAHPASDKPGYAPAGEQRRR